MKKLTPAKAIRAKCMDCCGDSFVEVRLCPAEKCILHPWRMGKRPDDARLSPLKAIRKKCLDDCGEPGSSRDVKTCVIKNCPVYAHRLGKRDITDEQRKKMSERAKQNTRFLKKKVDETNDSNI